MRPIKLFFCGDVMTGRGIDQILRQWLCAMLNAEGRAFGTAFERLAGSRLGLSA
jgi:hypothetical protein